jgi:hypothetical protein
MYAAYVYVRWLPDDGWDSQPKYVEMYKVIVQLLVIKTCKYDHYYYYYYYYYPVRRRY